MKFSVKDFFSKREQIDSFLWICSHLLEEPLMENFILCAVQGIQVVALIKFTFVYIQFKPKIRNIQRSK